MWLRRLVSPFHAVERPIINDVSDLGVFMGAWCCSPCLIGALHFLHSVFACASPASCPDKLVAAFVKSHINHPSATDHCLPGRTQHRLENYPASPEASDFSWANLCWYVWGDPVGSATCLREMLTSVDSVGTYFAGLLVPCGGLIPVCLQRQDIRKRFGITGDDCTDCLYTCCCGCCAIAQHEDELKARAVDETLERQDRALVSRPEKGGMRYATSPQQESMQDPIQVPIPKPFPRTTLRPMPAPVHEPKPEATHEPIPESTHGPTHEPIPEATHESTHEPIPKVMHEPIQEPSQVSIQEPFHQPIQVPTPASIREPMKQEKPLPSPPTQ